MAIFTTVEVYDDRIEITNPGGLLPLVAKHFGRKSLSRNPYIFSMFLRMNLVEHVGSGIGRMQELMLSANLAEPMFETDGMFNVVLYRKRMDNVDINLTELEKKLLDITNKNPKISVEELCVSINRRKSPFLMPNYCTPDTMLVNAAKEFIILNSSFIRLHLSKLDS